MPVVFRKRSRDFDPDTEHWTSSKHKEYAFITVKRTGHNYIVEGEEVELFTVTVLGEALDRSVDTVMLWEEKGVLPKPLFKVAANYATARKRWYSAAQIINLHNLLHYKYGNKKNWKFDKAGFIADVKVVFYKTTVVVNEKGIITP